MLPLRLLLALALLTLFVSGARADEVRIALVHNRATASHVVDELRRELSADRELRLTVARLNPQVRLTAYTYLRFSRDQPVHAGRVRGRLDWPPPLAVYGGLSPSEREPLTAVVRPRSGGGVQASARWVLAGTTSADAVGPRQLLVLVDPSPAEQRSSLWVAVARGFPRDLDWEQVATQALSAPDPRPAYLWLTAFPPQREATRSSLRALAQEDRRARAPLLRAGAWPRSDDVQPPERYSKLLWRYELYAPEPARVLAAARHLGPHEIYQHPARVARLDALAAKHTLPEWFRDSQAAPYWPYWDRSLPWRILASYLFPLLVLALLARWERTQPERALRGAYLLLLASGAWLLVDLAYRDVFDLLPDSWGWGFALCACLRLARVRRAGQTALPRSLVACLALGALAGIALEHSPAVGTTFELLGFLAAAGGLLGLAAAWHVAAELWEAHERPTWALWSRAAGPLGLVLGLGAMLAGRMDPSDLPAAFARALRWGPPLCSAGLPLAAALGLSVLWRGLPAGVELAPALSRRRQAGLAALVLVGGLLALNGPLPSAAAGYQLEASELPAAAGVAPLGSG